MESSPQIPSSAILSQTDINAKFKELRPWFDSTFECRKVKLLEQNKRVTGSSFALTAATPRWNDWEGWVYLRQDNTSMAFYQKKRIIGNEDELRVHHLTDQNGTVYICVDHLLRVMDILRS